MEDPVDAILAEMRASRKEAVKRRMPSPEPSRRDQESVVRDLLLQIVRARVDVMRGDNTAASESARSVLRAAKQLEKDRDAVVDAASLVAKLCKGVNGRTKRERVDRLCALDETYHRLRYAAMDAVPSPRDYFRLLLDKGTIDGLDDERQVALDKIRGDIRLAAREFLRSRGVSRSILDEWELLENKGGWNPLKKLFRSRWRESAWLLATSSSGDEGEEEPLAPSEPTDTMKRSDPIAPLSTRRWRQSLRDWTAREYSYAVPSEAALDALSSFRVVEVGAGVGYWARCLRERGTSVEASDEGGKDRDDYHGRFPTWTEVVTAASVSFQADSGSPPLAVLICYAPPDRPFLGDTVAAFAKVARVCDRLAVVGEWRGDTATPRCLDALSRSLELKRRITLPNWGDTSAELTLWGIAGDEEGASVSLPSLDACSVCGSKAKSLRRCRLTCDFDFCSQNCLEDAEKNHSDLIALKCFMKRPQHLDFNNAAQFRNLSRNERTLKRKKMSDKDKPTHDDDGVLRKEARDEELIVKERKRKRNKKQRQRNKVKSATVDATA